MLQKKGFLIAVVFIVVTFYFLFRNIDADKLLSAITRFHLIWLLPTLAIYLLGYVIRGFRWGVLLSPIKKCSFQSVFPTLMIGFMGNNILPARAGELLCSHLIGKKENISRSSAFATIILARIFDGLTMILLLWLSLFFGHLPIDRSKIPFGIAHAIRLAPYVFGTAFLILFLLVLFKKTSIQWINNFIKRFPQKSQALLQKIAHTFIDGLQILQNGRESLIVLLASLAAWTCEFSSYYFLAIGIGIAPTPDTFWFSALLMTIVNLAILIPNAPGGIGLFEFCGVGLLLPIGISKEIAVCYMFLLHFVILIPITLLGFYFFTREHLSFSKIREENSNKQRQKSSKKARP